MIQHSHSLEDLTSGYLRDSRSALYIAHRDPSKKKFTRAALPRQQTTKQLLDMTATAQTELPPRGSWKNRLMRRGSSSRNINKAGNDASERSLRGVDGSGKFGSPIELSKPSKKKGSGLIRKLKGSFRKEPKEARGPEYEPSKLSHQLSPASNASDLVSIHIFRGYQFQ